MSYLTQMAGLAVQNFVSAAVGMAVLAAVVRGIARRSTGDARQLLGRPLPLARLHPAAARDRPRRDPRSRRASSQTFHGHATATTLEGAQQTIARGPVASQIAIKQLGTNGGGFYNSNSAVPFENPNGLTNFLEMLAILLIPAAQVFMFGKMVLRAPPRAGWSSRRCSSMFVDRRRRSTLPAEQHGSQVLRDSGVNITQGNGQSGGNMSDKEVRFGIANTAHLGDRRRRDASNGSVNGGHDALTAGRRRRAARQHVPRRGDLRRRRLRPLRDVLLHRHRRLRRRADGRAARRSGSARRSRRARSSSPRSARSSCRRWCSTLTAVAIVTKSGLASIFNPGVHGFTETLYAYDSQSNNNGSAFAGYGATNFSADARHGRAATSAASCRCSRRSRSAARSRRRRSCRPRRGRSAPTAPTFVVLLVGVIALTAGLMIFPALTLGPIVEGLMH